MPDTVERDELLQRLAEINETLKTSPEPNKDALKAALREVLAESPRMIDPPDRKGVDGPVIPPIGEQVVTNSGKFRDMKATDIMLAYKLISGMNQRDPDRHPPPSKDLEDAYKKALTSTGSGTGDELVPTALADSLWMDMKVATRVAAQLSSIPMPTDPFDIPIGFGDVTFRKGTQNTAATASDPATSKVTMTSTEQVAEVDWSYDVDEDAVIAMLPSLQEQLRLNGAEQIDKFSLNADSTNAATGNINLDDADPADDSYYLSLGQDGLRHLALVDNTAQGADAGGALADTDMTAFIGKLGKYGIDPNRVVLVPGVEAYMKMLDLTNVATVDKYGPQATMLTGELAKYRGLPVVPSAGVPLTEADGKVSTTAGNNTLGQIVGFSRDQWKLGFRRQLTIEVDKLIQKRQFIMVVSFRLAVAAWGTRSTAKHTAVLYNITV